MTPVSATFQFNESPVSTGPASGPPANPIPTSLVLKADLQLHPREDGNSHMVLESVSAGTYFRLGIAESVFVSSLMQNHSVAKAAGACAERRKIDAHCPELTPNQIGQLCVWLQVNNLCTTETPAPPSAAKPLSQRIFGSFYYIKVPIMNPDRWLTHIVSHARWLFGWQMSVLSVIVCLVACVAMTGSWSLFIASYQNLITAWNGVWLLIAWCFLKLVHEIHHGGTCKRYGGEVRRAGIAFILLFPIAYIDVTSSWKFPSRWQRLHVALAGVTAELGIAGLALLVWYCTDSLPLKQNAANVFLLASVSSLLFNLNPLLKFDGYYALSDLMKVDNLYAYGQSYAQYWGGRYILGLDARYPNLPDRHVGWIKAYGLAAAVWRTMTTTGLIVAASAIFHGAGILIAVAGVVIFLMQPLVKLLKNLGDLYMTGKLNLCNLVVRITGIATICLAVLFVIPGEIRQTMPAIVEYDPPAILRAPTDGFIEQVHVGNGSIVMAGQPMATLRNDDLQLKLLALKKQHAQLEQQVRSARWTGDPSKLGELESEITGLAEQLAEAEKQVAGLVICAPTDGKVVSRHLATMLGTYVRRGEEIAAVGIEQRKRIKVSISQWEVSQAEQWVRSPLRVVVAGKRSWQTTVSHLESRADHTPPDWSLCASNGGYLPVFQDGGDKLMLCESRLNAYVSLTPEQSQQLYCGQRCFVRLNCSKQTLGIQLWQALQDAWRSRLPIA